MYPAKLKVVKGIKTAVLILVLILLALIDSSVLKLNILGASGSLTFSLSMLFCALNDTPKSLIVATLGAFLFSIFSGANMSLTMLNYLLCAFFLHFLNHRLFLKSITNLLVCVFMTSLVYCALFIAEEFLVCRKISFFYLKSIPLKCLFNVIFAFCLYPALRFLKEDII